MIREATIADVPKIFDLGQEMLNRMYGLGRVRVNREEGYRDMRMLINSKTGLVVIDVDAEGNLLGVLAAQRVKQIFTDHWYCVDQAFFVQENKPISALKLVRHFLWWAQQQKGVNEAIVNVTHGLGDPERMRVMYEKLGMTHLGGSFGVRFNKLAVVEQEAA